MQISRFHYLTQDLPDISHQELAEIACKNGIRWIQLRVKNKPFEDWLQIAKDVKQICNHFQTTLIINDHAEIAKAVDADGVHVGKNDVTVLAARKIVGLLRNISYNKRCLILSCLSAYSASKRYFYVFCGFSDIRSQN